MLYEKIEFPAGVPLKFCILEVEEYPYHMQNDVLEIIFMLEGTIELTVVNNVLQMAEGDIYICSPNELHRLCACDQARGIVMLIYIDLAQYKAEFPDIDTYQFANSALENNRTGIQILGNYLKKQIPKLLDERETAWTNVKEIGDKILRILIKEFQCYYLVKFYPEFNPIYKDNEIQLKRIRRIIDHIYRNYNKPIMIKDVADMEHISTYHLTYILKNGCGMGFRMFLNMARVEQSAAIILDSGKGLQTIAYECGFSKYQYFSESFEKVFRMTPRQYRQRYQDCTIAVKERRVRELDGAELETLIRKFCAKSQEIRLDLSRKYPERPFCKPAGVNLGARYDHIMGLPALRKLREEVSIQWVGIEGAFLRRCRNDLRAMRCLLSDFWALGVSVLVCLSGGDSVPGVRSFLELLNGLRPESAGRVSFRVAAREREGKAETIGELIAAFGYPVEYTPPDPEPERNPIHSSGYMPCYLLQSLARGERTCVDRIALMDEQGAADCGGLALLTDTGLEKPVYHLLCLLERMGDALIEQGETYFVTRTAGKADFQVLVYYYDDCFDALFQDAVKAAEHATFIDMVAKDCDSNREVSLHVGSIWGKYALRRYRLTAEDYLSRYRDTPFLDFRNLSEETLRVLNHSLAPEVTLSMLEANGTFSIDCKLDPFEMILFSFEKL